MGRGPKPSRHHELAKTCILRTYPAISCIPASLGHPATKIGDGGSFSRILQVSRASRPIKPQVDWLLEIRFPRAERRKLPPSPILCSAGRAVSQRTAALTSLSVICKSTVWITGDNHELRKRHRLVFPRLGKSFNLWKGACWDHASRGGLPKRYRAERFCSCGIALHHPLSKLSNYAIGHESR